MFHDNNIVTPHHIILDLFKKDDEDESDKYFLAMSDAMNSSLCFTLLDWKCWNELMVVIKIVEIFTNNQLYRGGRGLEYNHERLCFVSPGVLLLSSVMQSLTPSRPGRGPCPALFRCRHMKNFLCARMNF